MRSTFKGTRPAALFGDPIAQSTGRQVDWDSIPGKYRHGAVKVLNGAAATAADTTMTLLVPLGVKLSKGTVIDFGSGKFAKLAETITGTGAEVASIDVEALVADIADTTEGWVTGSGPKFLPGGTIMAQLSTGKVVPLAIITKTYTVSRTAKVGNTGNGVMTLAGTPYVTGVQVGVYKVIFIEPASNLGTFIVEDPNGVVIGEGVAATAFSNQIAFTIADGATDFVAGDEIAVTVAQSDGSTCAGILLTDATEGSPNDAVTGYGMVLAGTIFENLMPEAVAGVLTAAEKTALQNCGQGFVFEVYTDTRGS